MPKPHHQTRDKRPWRPKFLREIRDQIEDVGVTQAVHSILSRDNIGISVEGDYDRLKQHKGGVLLVGDHKHQWEFVAAAAMAYEMGYDDMRNVAKFYVQRQVALALGPIAAKNIIPVYPRLLVRERDGNYGTERFSRQYYRKSLLDADESRVANELAIMEAAGNVREGGLVNIFPCGSIVDSMTHPWRQGVGQIITELPEDVHQDVLVAPYRMVDASWIRTVAAVAMRGRGIFGRPQTMDIELAPIYTVDEIIQTLPDGQQDDPVVITDQLRQNFINYFSEEAPA
jgi:hypothetical protein